MQFTNDNNGFFMSNNAGNNFGGLGQMGESSGHKN